MTLSTLATDMKSSRKHYLITYSAASAFCLIFSLIYEYFSHDVWSYFMVLSFLIPLAGGLINFSSFFLFSYKSGLIFRQLINGASIWFTLGFIYQGVLEIYGTTNQLMVVFWIVGTALLVLALIDMVILLVSD